MSLASTALSRGCSATGATGEAFCILLFAVKDLPKLRRISSFVAAEGTGLTAFLLRGRKLEGVPEPTSLQRK